MQIQANVEPQPSIDTSKMTVISRIDNCFLHQFATQKLRQLLDVARCELLQQISIEGTEVPQYFIKVGSFVQSLEHCMLVNARFSNLITFAFENSQNPNAIYLISVQVFNPSADAFCNALRESVQVVDYKSDIYEKCSMKEKMDLICGGELTEDMIENIEYVGPILKTVGSVLGSVSKSAISPVAKAETIMTNSITMLSSKMVTGENKERWNNLKQTASEWNEKMTELYKPIDNAFKLMTSAIGQTFNTSENKYIKTIKSNYLSNEEFGMATASTLNNSYKSAGSQVAGGGQVVGVSNNENQNPYAMNEAHEVSTQQLN